MDEKKKYRAALAVLTMLWIVFALCWHPESLALKAVVAIITICILIADIYIIVKIHKYNKSQRSKK